MDMSLMIGILMFYRIVFSIDFDFCKILVFALFCCILDSPSMVPLSMCCFFVWWSNWHMSFDCLIKSKFQALFIPKKHQLLSLLYSSMSTKQVPRLWLVVSDTSEVVCAQFLCVTYKEKAFSRLHFISIALECKHSSTSSDYIIWF